MAPAVTLTVRQDPSGTAGAPPSTTSHTSSSGSKTVYIAVGVAVAVVAIIVLLCILCCCYRRRRQRITPATSKPTAKPEAFTLQSQHKPPVAPAKPSHYGGSAGYTASSEQSHGLLAHAAPAADTPVPTAYTGELYGQQPDPASSHAFITHHPTPHPPPNAASQESTHSQSQHRPPHAPISGPQQPSNNANGHGHRPSISVTAPVPSQQQQQQAPARPPKIGEAAVYFDTSVYIGTQRGRRADRQGSTERGQQRQHLQTDRSASSEARIREV